MNKSNCFHTCILLISLLCPVGIAAASPVGDVNPTIPADYIIAGNLNHELGQRWLKARGLKGQGEFEAARNQYIILLDTYPDLIQARFEYVQVLQVLNRFKEMEIELETLLELDPLNLNYKQVLGRLLFQQGRQKQGVILLEDVWQAHNEVDLGQLLYQTYTKSGQKQKSLAVLEYLYKQSVDDVHLQEDLFVLYIELGNDLKAQNFAPSLAEKNQGSHKILILAAQLHERLGLDHLAADYWQAVLRKQPDYQLAHEKLVQYYSANSRDGEALVHKIFLYSQSENDEEIAGEIGDYYLNVSECSQAVFFLERSLSFDPTQVQRLRGLAYCYNDLGDNDAAVRAFAAYFRLQRAPSSADRLVGARAFVQAGMNDAAAEQYRQLLVKKPGDIDLLIALAEVENSLGNFNEALVAWKQVAHKKVDDVVCRLHILSLSERLGITDIQTVLAEIHGLDQNDHRVSLLLALIAFKNGDFVQGMKIFNPLADSELFSADLLALRGEIFLFLDKPAHSFADFTEALNKNPDSGDAVVLGLLEVAGILGRLDTVVELNRKYSFATSPDLAIILLYAEALAECGDLVSSVVMYKILLDSENKMLHRQALNGLAKLYALHGFVYEAEQENRLNWIIHKDTSALLRLVSESLGQHKNSDAEYWLDQYALAGLGFEPKIYQLEIRLLLADGELDRALLLADEFGQVCAGSGADCGAMASAIKLDLAAILFEDGDIAGARQQVAQLGQQSPLVLEPFVYELKMAVSLDDSSRIIAIHDHLLHQASYDAGDLFELQRVANDDYGLSHFARSINRTLHKSHPSSLKYGLALIRSLIEKSSYDEAIDTIRKLQAVYPEAILLSLYGAEVSLAMGEFNQGLAFVNEIEQPRFFKEQLLRARLLWGAFQRDKGLAVYENNLTPDAENGFREKCESLHLSMPSAPDDALWLRLVKPMPGKESPLEKCFVSGGDSDSIKVGVSFFARKRWQDFFRVELAARKSVHNREYFHAVNQYESMADHLLEPTLLFDLAGVYSSLNRVGEEAVIYEQINQINPDFPGLSQAMKRNQLRRRPRTGLTVGYFEEDGREGYKDISEWRTEALGWYSPKPRQEGFLSASHLYYSGDKGRSIHGQELLLGVTSNVFDYFKFDLTGGVHLLDDEYPDKTVFNISITGAAGDFLKSYIGMRRRVVKDTLASLHRGVIAEEYTAQATIDLFPRLHVGGKLSFADYSDENDMSGYSFWGIFILQTQPDYLFFRVGYEFIDFQDGSGGTGSILIDGFQADDHPYWAPVNYWRNQYTLGYKHTYSDDILGHQVPGYVSAHYSIDYDSDGEMFHHLATGIHLEMSESWLFSFNGSVDFADEYDGYDVGMTLEYRW